MAKSQTTLACGILVILLLPACKKEPRCAPECVNGECKSGTCLCYKGWGGIACDRKLAPFSELYIDSASVWKWPRKKSSGADWDTWPLWDGDPQPELYLEAILSTPGQVIWSTSDTDGIKDTIMLYPTSNTSLDGETISLQGIYFILRDRDQGGGPDQVCITDVYYVYPDLTGENGKPTAEVLCGDSTVLKFYFSYVW